MVVAFDALIIHTRSFCANYVILTYGFAREIVGIDQFREVYVTHLSLCASPEIQRVCIKKRVQGS